jgi:hypothetical protein
MSDRMNDLCELCGQPRGDHAAVSPFMEEHFCPEHRWWVRRNRGFSATGFFTGEDMRR